MCLFSCFAVSIEIEVFIIYYASLCVYFFLLTFKRFCFVFILISRNETDIDECQNPGSCGLNALCQNTPGNYTCACPNGYGGNPYDGVRFTFLAKLFPISKCQWIKTLFEHDQCADIDECEIGNACGTGSLCTNTDGGYTCTCPPGFTGDPKVACVDVDECAPPPPGVKATPVCGRSAICDNLPGSFKCQCPPGFKGDPKIACQGSWTFFFRSFSSSFPT